MSRVNPEQRIRFRPSAPLDDRLLTDLKEVHAVTRSGPHITVTGGDGVLQAVTAVLARRGVIAADLRVDQTTLDDAFVALTGREIR